MQARAGAQDAHHDSSTLSGAGSLSRSRSEPRGARGRSPAHFQATSQARLGLLGHLSLRDTQDGPDALRKVSALDGVSFLPHVMTMQRPSTPWQYSTPTRLLEEPAGAGGAEAGAGGERRAPGVPRKKLRDCTDYRQQIADLKLLADSAGRSGSVNQALQAYHKMGVVLDNQGLYAEAVKNYKHCLALCISSNNTQGEALAYNCLGIDSFKLGNHDEAIQYHNKHLELADGAGRLIAHTNLGIVFQAMELSEHAAIHHQHAIEYANRLGAKDAQCFTVGNLGIATAAQGDFQTSRICLQYHLTTAERQKHLYGDAKFAHKTLKSVSDNAYRRLGVLNTNAGRLDEAASHFAKAMEASRSKGDQDSEEKSGAMFGIAKGLQTFDQHIEALVKGQAGDEVTTSC
eukprot:CAMPEP_0179265692 /NCGR_PEP_ID=MMETSP0797-20121207/29034_1 /TAXON_ID=47934 /ORGANISM="Dinophysis acuminata, Strain DAEP01" /LENGTH=401 /DNA_ID=CAMNT_0020973907 /DNA_START=6 /DNA_END=1211 /DNA_ORIENTATION=-